MVGKGACYGAGMVAAKDDFNWISFQKNIWEENLMIFLWVIFE